MKEYKLKRWYPSLDKSWVEGDIIRPTKNGYYYNEGKNSIIHSDEVENNPDFWEEVKHPLFVTEDGVEVYINNVELFAVNEIFETASAINFDFDCCKKEGWKLFFHKANADEYIWRNKPQFSYEDIIRYLIHSVCDIEQLNHLVQGFRKLAKERSEQ